MKLPFIFILLFLFPFLCQSVFRGQRRVSDGCERLHRSVSAKTTNLPTKFRDHYDRPWMSKHFNAMFYHGTDLTYNWFWFKQLKIQGLDGTLEELLQFFDKNDCFFIPYGEGVRNILIGTVKDWSLLKLSGETTCDAFKLFNICSTIYGRENCGSAPTTAKDKVTFGNSQISKQFDETIIGPIVISPWDSTFPSERIKWGYTANMGAIFDDLSGGTTYFIDFSGETQNDICARKVKAPLQQKYWKDWAEKSLIKVLNAYTLIADGFIISDVEFRQFIIDSVKEMFDNSTFQEWYCKNIFGGIYYPSIQYNKITQTKRQTPIASKCHYLLPDARRNRLIKNTNQTLHEDFDDFWHKNLTQALNRMHLVKEMGQIQKVISKNETILREYSVIPAGTTTRVQYPPPRATPFPPPTTRTRYRPTTTTTTPKPITTSTSTTQVPPIMTLAPEINVVNSPPRNDHQNNVISHNVPRGNEIKESFKMGEVYHAMAEETPYIPPEPTIYPPVVKEVRMKIEIFTVKNAVPAVTENYQQHEVPHTLAEDY